MLRHIFIAVKKRSFFTLGFPEEGLKKAKTK
jgi:hypothetical protein